MKDKSLIKNSTREERQKRVNGAIAIQMTEGPAPPKEAMDLYQKYIDGAMEIDEILKILIEKYTVK
ncbi:hypothetical protein BCD96_005917 [Clostridium beijerinckii]|uniref:Antitoxin VbhA domain-containing protein n=1 Tax=Clostridium beijerinckii TaxID=1520 RepID=A0AAX0BBM3_CLOBE|nr:antitoxin VbhA family protein [Clostridium beijerinckii]MBA8937804.1 hypothetical protein [Clostridium beijerinckii]NRT92391.1 hypothetical protein [Clostridium beijerinckii]NRU41695.1 hypothetical protein [Clostridium beijerinckii]NSB00876.1 hypothetical protein [Clostridium beijerinckii]